MKRRDFLKLASTAAAIGILPSFSKIKPEPVEFYPPQVESWADINGFTLPGPGTWNVDASYHIEGRMITQHYTYTVNGPGTKIPLPDGFKVTEAYRIK